MSNREILKTENVLVRVMELEPEDATEWHFHSQVSDIFVCMKGTVRIETRSPEKSHLLEPGQLFEVGPGTVHRVMDESGAGAEYLLVQGVGAYDFCTERPEGERPVICRE